MAKDLDGVAGMVREFESSLGAYVRKSAGELIASDTRAVTAKKLAEIGPEMLGEMLPHDLVAIFSAGLAPGDSAVLASIRTLKGAKLRQAISVLSDDRLPLRVDPAQPARIIDGLRSDPLSHGLYRDIALLVEAASHEEHLRPYLWGLPSRKASKPDADTVSDAADGADDHEEGSLFDNRDESRGEEG